MKIFNHSIMRYAIVGIIGTAIHFLMLMILVKQFAADPVLASSIGFVVVLIISYYLNQYWTFNHIAESPRAKRFIKYVVVSVCGLLLNTAVMYTSIHWLQLQYIIGQCLVVIVVPIFNYFLNRNWTFKAISDS